MKLHLRFFASIRESLGLAHEDVDLPEQIKTIDDLRLPGWRLHALHTKPRRHAIDVNGPWRITFEWEDGDVVRIDLEQYH